MMQQILQQLKIKADVVSIESNGIMSKYYLRLQPGGRINKIERCAAEIALGLKSYSIPIVKVIPEDGLVLVELLINRIDKVNFDEVINFSGNQKIPLVLGRSYDGNDLIADLSEMPHMLVAGTTGSGKSVLLHSILSGIILSGYDIKLVLIDPKQVEFLYYAGIKQLMYPVISYPADALYVLSDLVEEMETRFKIMSRAGVNHISELKKKMPYIVVVIDEFSDLMLQAKKEFSAKISKLAQKARSCGIHLIISTQHVSVNIVSGPIKANFPSRISCKVSSLTNSRVILDRSGAEKLLGKGDAIINSGKYDMLRFQSAYISCNDIKLLSDKNKMSKVKRILNYIAR